jgi:hypothetical protein
MLSSLIRSLTSLPDLVALLQCIMPQRRRAGSLSEATNDGTRRCPPRRMGGGFGNFRWSSGALFGSLHFILPLAENGAAALQVG